MSAKHAPRWEEVREDWEYDGALLDVSVDSTSFEDWQRVIEVVRSRRWSRSYTEDGDPTEMPGDVREVFQRRLKRATSWEIRPSDEIRVGCHFFSPDKIEFDLDPREIGGQRQLDTVCEFIRAVGHALGKPIHVGWEGFPSAVILAYDPATDLVSRPGNGRGSPIREVARALLKRAGLS